MNWWTIFTNIFDIVYLLAVFMVLWRIMLNSEHNAKANQIIVKTLSDTATSNAQSANKAAQAAQDAVGLLKENHHGSK